VDPAVSVAVLATPDVAAMLGLLAERFWSRPSEALRLIGVTGTNGKTTVSHLVQHILNSAQLQCGLIGTVRIDDGKCQQPATLTTPSALELSARLAAMVGNHCSAAVLEVSSHALHQRRTAGLAFDVGVFTNLSGDHLDYHDTPQAYADAKAMLFRSLPSTGYAVINIDDAMACSMMADCPAIAMTCSLSDRSAECFAEIGRQAITRVEAIFHGPWGSFEVRLPLAGKHNVTNALQAAATAFALGIGRTVLQSALEQCEPPPGRLEAVTGPGDEFTVLVDYAHTDAALANVLQTLRPLVPPEGRLRVVFGAGGDRDRTKRPRMGRVAAAIADDLIITSDNPRTETPASIIDEIAAGVPGSRRPDTMLLADRRQAIEVTIGEARPGDVVLIAGKGHEPYQVIGTERRPFDDRAVAAAALDQRRRRRTTK
jgi:UDP-N-acetylmuramoyl-L-alanyl-D-glutamate--2,6-diaminopimelate ligase